MYKDYIREKIGYESYENETGFALYKANPVTKIMDVADFYIKPEYRVKHYAKDFFLGLVKLAKENGCNKFTGGVCVSHKDPEVSLKALLRVRFKISHIHEDMIYFYQYV